MIRMTLQDWAKNKFENKSHVCELLRMYFINDWGISLPQDGMQSDHLLNKFYMGLRNIIWVDIAPLYSYPVQ